MSDNNKKRIKIVLLDFTDHFRNDSDFRITNLIMIVIEKQF